MPARAQRTASAILLLLASGAAAGVARRASGGAAAQEATPAVPQAVQQEATPTVQVIGLTPEEAIRAHETAERGPAQPIPFSHRFHVTELRMDCNYCHVGTERSQVAVVPPLEICIGCHRVVGSQLEPILRLRQYWESGEPVPWERVYKLPEFVQFWHQPHLRNGIPCQECHGPVEQMDRVYQATSLRMGWCLGCHFGEPQPTDVATDYLLSREYPPAEIPEGRQESGLYPRRIDQQYASNRAPIDCVACHH